MRNRSTPHQPGVVIRVHALPVDRNPPSTGVLYQGVRMTHTPFDDLDAFDRRWSDRSRMRALADADPLLFVADHVMSVDRREGTVALHIATDHGPPTLLVIPDGPPDPRDRDCAVLLSNVVSGIPDAVSALGLVHHRLGGPDVSDLDRRWAEALKAASYAHGFEPIGVIARLYDGSLVRVPVPEVLPEDYADRVA